MLLVATCTYPASKCPLETVEGKVMMKKLFSVENIGKSGMKMVSAYFSCPKDKNVEHNGFFIVEVDNASTIATFFGSMSVDVRPIVQFSEVAKTL